MKHPKTEKTNRAFDKYERLVVNAVKGFYQERFGTDGYALALRIIERVVYGNPEGRTPYYIKLDYLRTILLKSRNWELDVWEDKTRDRFSRAMTDHVIWKEDFFDTYLRLHLSDVLNLQINAGDAQAGYVNILDLDLAPEFEETSLAQLDKSE